MPAPDTAPNTHMLKIEISWFAIATPANCSVPILPTVILFTRPIMLVMPFCTMMGIAIRSTIL